MQFIKRHFAAILFVVIAVALVVFGSRLLSESARMIDVLLFGFFCSALLVLPVVEAGDKILKKLKELEPKTGGTLGPNVVGVQRDHRNDLEYSLVHALAPHLVNTKSAPELGAFIRDVVNSIQGRGCQAPTKVCTCGPNAGCTNCPGGGCQSLNAAQDGLSQSAARTAEAWAGVLGKTS
ncbi:MULTISPECIES: hypothetical protein [Comamonas]|uniref:hypothetical protein n=1 Tax=Comamonas TaxID=283 RepID=UPI0001DA6E51|nr:MULTISPECIES: hypothetical protein [Comamonas]EFI61355.1 hypothetical protein CTS44_12889 [Comamonas thiooxydans]TFF62679.1 hypothetical protein EIC84_00980 [Comamonas sp. A23]